MIILITLEADFINAIEMKQNISTMTLFYVWLVGLASNISITKRIWACRGKIISSNMHTVQYATDSFNQRGDLCRPENCGDVITAWRRPDKYLKRWRRKKDSLCFHYRLSLDSVTTTGRLTRTFRSSKWVYWQFFSFIFLWWWVYSAILFPH